MTVDLTKFWQIKTKFSQNGKNGSVRPVKQVFFFFFFPPLSEGDIHHLVVAKSLTVKK